MDICIFLYRISKTLWERCSYWSGLSVTNEPSGTGTGIPAKDVISVWVAHAWPQVAHTDLCVCVSESSILCGQWGCGSCKPAIALASVVLQLIYWTARHGREVVGGVKERSRPLRKLSPAVWSRLPGFVHSFSFPPTNVEQNTGDMILGSQPCCVSHYQCATLDKGIGKS